MVSETTLKSQHVIDCIKGRMDAVDLHKPRKLLGVYQVNIKNSGGHTHWVIDLNKLEINSGIVDNPDITIDADDDVFHLVAVRTVRVEAAIANGDLKLKGDETLIKKLIDFVDSNHLC